MLSAIPRQALRVASATRVSSIRTYSTGINNTTGSEESSSSPSKATETKKGSIFEGLLNKKNATSVSSEDKILETLNKAQDRQQQSGTARSSTFTSFLNPKSFRDNSGRSSFLSEPQTTTHNLHIHASMNNTILTLTDSAGDPITTQSAGSAGFKKSARSGPEAGYQAMIKMIEKVEEKNVQIQTLHVLMKGFGPGRDSAFKAIRAKTNWDIKRISDTTPIPFNGCRPPKARRL
ncbi:small subunit ribosomal protein S11 [Entomortierella parvispora]|uniref:Small subunit ribosomal protein S11 n=1 Tax=Entomortierella parvispora TaxID=205924 RepID=A0A9P3H2X9_9FUNG|nr:small subunit ribosomal protein S11 [Entomortierella parvispora]